MRDLPQKVPKRRQVHGFEPLLIRHGSANRFLDGGVGDDGAYHDARDLEDARP
jgi:hypothetical protein